MIENPAMYVFRRWIRLAGKRRILTRGPCSCRLTIRWIGSLSRCDGSMIAKFYSWACDLARISSSNLDFTNTAATVSLFIFNPSCRGRQAQSEAAWAMMIDFLNRGYMNNRNFRRGRTNSSLLPASPSVFSLPGRCTASGVLLAHAR